MLLWGKGARYGRRRGMKKEEQNTVNISTEQLEGAHSVSIDGVLEVHTEREEYRVQKKEELYNTVAEQE